MNLSDVIYVTKQGTFYKGREYKSGETIPTNRWGGPVVKSNGQNTQAQNNNDVVVSQNELKAQESTTEQSPESLVVNSPSSSVVDSSKLKQSNAKINQAYLKNTVYNNREINPSETLASKPVVEQSALTFNVDTRGRVESDVPGKGEKLNRKFSEARQEFKDNLLTQNNYQTPDAFENIKVAGEVVVLGGVSFGKGLVKGGAGAVKDVVTGQIVTDTGEFLTEVVSNPVGVLDNAKVDFQNNPSGFLGEQFGYGVVVGKLPGVTKKVYKGSRNYINRYEIGGSKYDPLVTVPNSGEAFYRGDLDVAPNVQTTLTGERVNPRLLLEKPKKSPLGLDDTSLYARENEIKIFQRELESGKIVKETPIFDDATFIPESRIDGAGFVELKSSDLNVRVPVDKVFEGRYVGERTKTDFFSPAEKIPVVYAENIAPSSKPLFNVKSQKNVVDADYIEFRESDVVKDSSVQKKLNFEEGTDRFIGANVGLFTESQKLFENVRAEFNVKPKSVASGFDDLMIESRPRRLVYPDVSSKSVLGSNRFVLNKNEVFFVNKSIIVPEQIVLEDVKPLEDSVYRIRNKSKINPKVDNVLLQKSKQDVVVDFNLVQRQEVKQVYSPLSKQVSRKDRLLRYKNSKVSKVFVPKLKYSLREKKGSSFVAEVRKRGKFVGVGVFDSSEKAFGVARGVVSNSASASLRVRRVGGGVVSPVGFVGKQFRLSKMGGGVLVERRGQRIKSVGEKAEITMKGIMVSKSKKLFGGLRV